MPINDRQRKKIVYPHLRRRPRPDTGATTIISETIVRTTEFLSLGAPGLFINNATFTMSCDFFDDPFQRMVVVTGSALSGAPQ